MGYDVMLVADAHSTWNSGNLSGQQIIDHHNRVLKWFARVKEAGDIQFNECKWMPIAILRSVFN